MVKLEEVDDEELNAQQPGPKDEEDEWDTDDGMLRTSVTKIWLLTELQNRKSRK